MRINADHQTSPRAEYALRTAVWLTVFLLPIKLSWALAVYVPTVIGYLWWFRLSGFTRYFGQLTPARASFGALIAWLCVVGLFGLSPINSFYGCTSLVFYALLIIIVLEVGKSKGPLFLLAPLLIGQSLSSIHSILNAAFPEIIPEFLIGKVTESGQLALVIPIALGVWCSLNSHLTRCEGDAPNFLLLRDPFEITLRKLLFFSLLVVSGGLAFSDYLNLSMTLRAFLFLGFLSVLAAVVRNAHRRFRDNSDDPYVYAFLASNAALPLCATALLINLKRGPWIGVVVSCAWLLLLYSRRMIGPILGVLFVIAIALQPVRIRIAQSAEHFFIHGGRKAIWDIGVELTQRYPLGIGYQNSGVLREFSTEIPVQLKHFHSNILNILVETGWIGLAFFIWWLAALFRASISFKGSQEATILSRGIAASILSWQLAGLVEYNFGDTEVMLIVFAILGIFEILQSKHKFAKTEPESRCSDQLRSLNETQFEEASLASQRVSSHTR